MTIQPAMHDPIWTPSAQRVEASVLRRFCSFLQRRYPDVPVEYEPLHAWSIANKAAFWEAIWQFAEVRGDYDPARILEDADRMPGARWFPGATLNYAENLLARGAASDTALIEHREDGRRRQLSYAELRGQCNRLARTLRELGVAPGDRVAAFVPNGLEAVVGMLASAQIGAIWTSCSPDFGFQGVIDRFGQVAPKVLLGINAYHYNGKAVDTRDRVRQIVESLPQLKTLIAIDNLADYPWADLAACRGIRWDHALAAEPDTVFVPMAFDAPLFIMYSSGTTGTPKCIVHSAGGTLLQLLKEMRLHTDVGPEDVIFYYTTCGWMMWNWLTSALATGAAVVLYDGSPFAGGAERLWKMAEQEGITIFGASAKYYASCEKAGYLPGRECDLDRLRSVLSTGSPLSHESFDYIYSDIKRDLCVSSISGGTDILSCFALGCPVLPVYRGELQCLGLGMDVCFVDDDGEELAEGKGELVCRSPFPSTPLGFWDDGDGSRFRAAYFDRFPGRWAHGDYGEVIAHPPLGDQPAQRGVIIHGRSDAVLNPGGVRIGTAEIYRQVEKLDAVLESVAIGQTWGDDVRVVLFVVLRQGLTLDDALQAQIRDTIRSNTTPRHVPARIVQVADIPRTISGKIVELAVRNVVHGEAVKNKDAIANPQALDYFANRPELAD